MDRINLDNIHRKKKMKKSNRCISEVEQKKVETEWYTLKHLISARNALVGGTSWSLSFTKRIAAINEFMRVMMTGGNEDQGKCPRREVYVL